MDRTRWAVVGAAVVIAALMLLIPQGSSVGTHSLVTAPPAGSGTAPITPAGASNPASVLPAAIAGPFNGRVFNTSTGPYTGAALGTHVAIDNGTGTVYSANAGGSVTAFDMKTGELLRAATLLPYQTVAGFAGFSGIVYDPTANTVFVSVESMSHAGYILELNAATLTQVANISGFSTPGFQPLYMVYDKLSDELLVQNASEGIVGMVNATSHAVITTLTPTCTSYCYSYGLVDMAPWHPWVVVEDGDSYAPVVGLYSHSLLGGYYAATSAFGFGSAVYDSQWNLFWVLNSSAYQFPEFEVFNATTGTYLASLYGVEYASAPVYDPVKDAILVPEENLSIAGGAQIAWYDGGTGIQATVYYDSTLSYYNNYASLALASNATAGMLIGTGGVNGQDQELSLGTFTISLVRNYSAIPLFYSSELDPAHGLVIGASETGALYAFSTTTGAVAWQQPNAVMIYPGEAVDPTLGTIYIANTTGIDVRSVADGSMVGSVSVPGLSTAYLLSADATHNVLYAYGFNASGNSIWAFNLSGDSGTYLGGTALPGSNPCFLNALLAVPAFNGAALDSCSYTPYAGNVTFFSGTTFNITGVVSTGPQLYGLTADDSGNIYASSLVNRTVTVANAATLANHTYTLPAGLYPLGVTYDSAIDALLVTSINNSKVEMFAPSTGTMLGSVTGPATSFGVAVDNSTGSFYATSIYTGQAFLANIVPLPTSVGALTLTAGNTTVQASWTAASGTSGFPITGYTLQWSANASGPWTSLPSTTALESNITGLTDGTPYYVTVYATSAAGVGPKAATATATPIGVPYPPTTVTATATGTGSVNLSWAAPSSTQGSAVTGYTVQWATSLTGTWQTASAGLATHYAVTNLASGTQYYFRVTATNAAGTGNPSTTATATTQSAPSGGLGALFSGTTGIILIAVIVLVIAAIAVAAIFMSRRGRKGSSAPQSWAPPPSGTPPATPAPEAPASPPPTSPPPSGGPPPGAM